MQLLILNAIIIIIIIVIIITNRRAIVRGREDIFDMHLGGASLLPHGGTEGVDTSLHCLCLATRQGGRQRLQLIVTQVTSICQRHLEGNCP